MVASGYKHLSLEERKSIEVLLNHSDIKLKQIALSINHRNAYVKKSKHTGSYVSTRIRRTNVDDKILVRNIAYAHIA